MQELMIASKIHKIVELPNRPKSLLDRQVAEIYEVETKRINEAVDRNPNKFPADFVFELTNDENQSFEVAICDRKFSYE